ncbi:hypothetical protein Clacol_000481 [Clathrus columnatus]|uniref:Amidohydrolase 3 domain-containing protein n=1 Tax=Clathrus columnatus TaxID=1419009 RepID=A0AAV4ZZW4_9AGAM|nr:hypothetical protein Clacol_000481 [Clathrus columnatus]
MAGQDISDFISSKSETKSTSYARLPPARQRTLDRGRLRAILASIVLGLCFVVFQLNTKTLPRSYILCSPDKKIYTVDPHRNVTDCILVHEKFIMGVGSLHDVKKTWKQHSNKNIVVRYAKRGSIIIPGMIDSHGHILEHGKKLKLDLDGLTTPADAVQRIRKYIEERPSLLNDTNIWIHGGGWDNSLWTGWPTAADLESDPVVRNRPVVLLSKDGHAFWCSKKAILLSSPLPETVEGGIIERDKNGEPIGTFLDKAMDLIRVPPWTEEQILEYFNATVTDALSHGLTGIQDAALSPALGAIVERLADENKLPIRLYAMRFFNESEPYWGKSIPKIVGKADGRLTMRSVKIFTDGALRSAGAALYEPYTDDPISRGFFRTPSDVLQRIIPRFLEDGWQVNTHCIGDRANGFFLDLMENLTQHMDVSSSRPRVEHAQIIAPGDFIRMGKLGVIASVQPSHVIDDMGFAESRLGPERIKGTYAFRTLIDNHVSIALGTDFPVADINPLMTFYAAITRLSIYGDSPHGPSGWFPEQRLTRQEALKGSLTPGKRADYSILSKDIMEIPPQEILRTKVIATVLDGEVVYGKL